MNCKEYSSGGIIIKDGAAGLQVLLIKDTYGHWTWPKGNIEKGETPQQTAIREIGEEVGLRGIALIDIIDRIHYTYKRQGRPIAKTVYYYLFEATGEERVKILASEVDDARWFSIEDARKHLDYRGSKTLFQKALALHKKSSY